MNSCSENFSVKSLAKLLIRIYKILKILQKFLARLVSAIDTKKILHICSLQKYLQLDTGLASGDQTYVRRILQTPKFQDAVEIFQKFEIFW